MFYIYKCWFLTLRKQNLYRNADELFEKIIYPLYLKYTKIQEREDQIKNGRYDINEKIEVVSSILEKECREIVQKFFEKQRK